MKTGINFLIAWYLVLLSSFSFIGCSNEQPKENRYYPSDSAVDWGDTTKPINDGTVSWYSDSNNSPILKGEFAPEARKIIFSFIQWYSNSKNIPLLAGSPEDSVIEIVNIEEWGKKLAKSGFFDSYFLDSIMVAVPEHYSSWFMDWTYPFSGQSWILWPSNDPRYDDSRPFDGWEGLKRVECVETSEGNQKCSIEIGGSFQNQIEVGFRNNNGRWLIHQWILIR